MKIIRKLQLNPEQRTDILINCEPTFEIGFCHQI